MAELLATHRPYVLLHQTTGTALYTTCATEAEIHRANRNLQRAVLRVKPVGQRLHQ